MSIVFKELGQFKKIIVLLVVSVVVTTLCSMFMPMLLQHLIDYAIPTKAYDRVFVITGLMLVCVALLLVAGIGTARFAAEISMGLGHTLRKKVFEKVTGFSQQEVDHFTISSLITRSNTDVQNIQTFVALSLSIAITAPIMCIIGAVMAFASSPDLSKILFVAIPVLVIAMAILGKFAIPLAQRIQKNLDRINMLIREKLTGTRVIRAFGTTQFEEERFEEVNERCAKTNKAMMRVTGAFLPVIVCVLSVTIAAIFYFAVQMHLDGVSRISTGEVLALVSYIMYIMMSVIMLSMVFLLLPRASTSASRVKAVLESESLIKEAEQAVTEAPQHGCLEFKNVSFSYAGAPRPAVNELSFKTVPGQTTAIIGGTGAGKSTIINMIPRLFDASEGQVLVDGVNVRDWDLEALRAKIGFVPQKAVLFKGTIDSNLAFGDFDPTEQAIEEAVRIAQSEDFVLRKKQQYQAPVAQGGSNFSGGQKQRLCIARALVRHPEIYIFDDSFSALDFKTDKTLRQALKTRTQNATTIIVAQRVNTIMDADQIIVIDKGDIMGIGTHQELLESCEVYREIVRSQMKEEVE